MEQLWWICLRNSKRSQTYFIHSGLVVMGSHTKRVLYPHHNSFILAPKWIWQSASSPPPCTCVKQVRAFSKIVLHSTTCIIYEMQYHIWIVMCTIFTHLPILSLLFKFNFLCCPCSLVFLPWSVGNYWIGAIYLFLYIQQLASKGYFGFAASTYYQWNHTPMERFLSCLSSFLMF